ncbi:helix-turn-helix domain-containing protein [Chryseobacterium rhizoplanae]|uniref:helix-turn-helix domain-containing protein n=1 Tax=Chryseobacterium rhizoplanae TaxID=1609531 RepID=UPI001CE37964|nr:helix-turn-helix domain-containing protein [Chryseobacterium rhizoplanae]UCA58261.1 helix-turn-helix domain-containing protein [Chryseobacterium rhizoplanae]
MHIYLVSLIDKKVQEAMVKFSKLPIQTSVLTIRPLEELLYHSGTILKTYIKLLKTLHILPDYNHYYRRQLLIKYTLNTVIIENNQVINKDYLQAIQNMVLSYLQDESSDQPAIVPIHIHFTTMSETFLISGISICKRDKTLAYSLLHETAMPNSQIHGYSIPGYLEELWDTYLQNPYISLRALCSGHRKSYTVFQKDSKRYLGTTFYRFYQQYKMLEALDDLMLTDLSIKEIAYKHEFTDYNQLYKLFHRQYRFPFKDIPRLIIENVMLRGVLFAIFL